MYKIYPTIIFLITTIVASLASNAAFRGVGEISDAYKLSYSPADPAFAIWGLIYTLLVVYSGVQGAGDEIRLSNALLGCSVLCATAWVPLFTRNTAIGFWTAAAALTACACLSVAAITVMPDSAKSSALGITTVELPLSLFGGWVSIATAIGIGVALSASGIAVPRYAAIVAAIAIAAVAASLNSPMYAMPAVWGLLWAPRCIENWTGIATLVVAAVVATSRRVIGI